MQKVVAKQNLSLFDLELRPTTFNPSLDEVNVISHTENEGRRSNDLNRRVRTLKQTSRRYQMHYLPCFTVDEYQGVFRTFPAVKHANLKSHLQLESPCTTPLK